ncbi:MAG: hypothetical protein AAF489_08815 [Bacteroidota bacterium]
MVYKHTTNTKEKGILGKVTSEVCGAKSVDILGHSNVINSREGKIFGVKTLPIPALSIIANYISYTAFAKSLATPLPSVQQ